MGSIKKLELRKINLDTLYKIKSDSRESTIYHDGVTAYKIYTGLDEKEKEKRGDTLEKLSLITPIKNVIWPEKEIVSIKKSIFNHIEYQTLGNTMKYIDGAIPFYRIEEYSDEKEVYINMSADISKTLKEVHEAGILLPDFNFSNVLVDKNLNYYFSDFDSASLDGTIGAISSLSAYYLRKKGILIPDKAIEEYDKISLLMQFAGILLEDNILSINEYNYDKKAEEYEVLKKIKNVIFDIKNSERVIKTVPYLHEIISTSEKKYQKTSKKVLP